MKRLLYSLWAMFAAFGLLVSLASPAVAQELSAAEWKAGLLAAKPGETIDYGTRVVPFQRQVFQPATCCVILKGGVYRGGITLDTWKNVIIDGAKFEDPDNKGTYNFLILAYAPENLTIRNSEFVGAFYNGVYQTNSISFRGGKNVTLQRNKFHDLANFLAFSRTDGVLVEYNDFWNIREGIQLPATQNFVIRFNKIGPFVADVPAAGQGDHADGIQIFMNGFDINDKTLLATGFGVIQGNLVIANTGLKRRAQCMLIQDEMNITATGRPIRNLSILDNTCLATGWHGISANVVGAENITIEGNRLYRLDGDDPIKDNWIATKPGTNIVVRNNTGPRFMLDASTAASNNTIDLTQPSTDAYAKVISDWDAKYRASNDNPPVPTPTPTPPPANDNAKLLERAQKARTELNDLKNGATRALYAIDQLITALGGSK